MFNKMLLKNQTPSYLKRYGFTYQTNEDKKNLLSVEGYTTKTVSQEEIIEKVLISNPTAEYRLEYFIDTTAAEPAQTDRGYRIVFICYNSENTNIGYVGPAQTAKGQKAYVTCDCTFPEDTAYVQVRITRYPSTVNDYNKVSVSGLQFYEASSQPSPDSPVDIKSNIAAGRYYIEYDGSKYEFTLPELNGTKDARDVFYFDKKKKSAFVMNNVRRESINMQSKSVGFTSSGWQRDGYTSFYVPDACPGATHVNNCPVLINRLNSGKWTWQGLTDGNYGYVYAPQALGIFYAIIQNSYLDITSSDSDDEKKTKIKNFLTQNTMETVYKTAGAKKIPITLTKVQTSTAEKLDLWEE